MPNHPLCELFQITPHEIEAQRAFLGITAEDETRLARIHEVIRDDLDAIVSEFYDHLLRHGELERFLGDPPVLDRLKAAQKKYLLSMGLQSNRLDYFEGRLQIGVNLERAGLQQNWYLGASSVLFDIIGRRLAAIGGLKSGELMALMTTLKKILTLDSGLVVETYYKTATQQLENALQQLTEVQHSLQKVSRLDGLTQVNSRRFLMEALEQEWHRSGRFHRPFTVLFVDLDHFKQVNDKHGHGFGDFVLQQVVQVMHNLLRPADILGRYGGEEFVIGLVEADEKIAEQIAERIRKKISESSFQREEHKASVTVSIGVAAKAEGVERLEVLIERADRALYKAKDAGRNRVCAYR